MVVQGGARPVVICYFIEDVVPMMAVAAAMPPGGMFAELHWVCDDTFGGLVTANAVERLGSKPFVLPWGAVGRRIRAIAILRNLSGAWGITVDGHGPYGEVNPGLVRLLQALDALLLPIGVAVRPQLSVRLRARLAVPVPWSLVSPRVGRLVDVRESGRHTAVILRERLLGMRGSAG